MTDLLEQVMSRQWFYRSGCPMAAHVPTYHGDELDLIHQTRWRMLEHVLEQTYPERFC